MQAIEEITSPLIKKCKAGKAGIIIVLHPGDHPPGNAVDRVKDFLAESGLKTIQLQLSDLAPNPVECMVMLSRQMGKDVFSIVCDPRSINIDNGALVTALNIHRNTFAQERLCAIFWIPTWAMKSFVERASNFIDFRTRLVEVGLDGEILKKEEESPLFFVPPPLPSKETASTYKFELKSLTEIMETQDRVLIEFNPGYEDVASSLVKTYIYDNEKEITKSGGVFWVEANNKISSDPVTELARKMGIRINSKSKSEMEKGIIDYLRDNPKTTIILNNIETPDMLDMKLVDGKPLIKMGGKIIGTTSDENIALNHFNESQIIRIYQKPPGFILQELLSSHNGPISEVSWSPNGNMLASASYDRTVKIWQVEGTKKIELHEEDYPALGVSWSPDGKIIASCSGDHTIRLWSIDSQSIVEEYTLKGHNGRIYKVTWSHDGELIASASRDYTIIIWNSSRRKYLWKLIGHQERVYGIDWHPTERILASCSRDETVRLWDVSRRKEIAILEGHTKPVLNVKWHPKGNLLASCSSDKTVRIWDVNNKKSIEVIRIHNDRVVGLSFSHDGKILASKSLDNTVKLSRCYTWECVCSLDEKAEYGNIHAGIAFHPSKPILATLGEQDTIIRIWELDFDLLLKDDE